jgi:hypothetical protein
MVCIWHKWKKRVDYVRGSNVEEITLICKKCGKTKKKYKPIKN